MIIGHHILYGKIQSLERPLVSVERVETGGELKRKDGEELMDLDEEMEVKVEYRVKSVIKKKIIFKNRPKPIIANLPSGSWHSCQVVSQTLHPQDPEILRKAKMSSPSFSPRPRFPPPYPQWLSLSRYQRGPPCPSSPLLSHHQDLRR